MIRLKKGTFAAVGIGLAATVMLTAPLEADARRGGSFGSRGARTYNAPATTNVAPRQTAPMQRSMTDRPAGATQAGTAAAGAGAAATSQRGGMAKGLLGGLLAGGLIGALLGGGMGALGGAGAVMALLQIVLIGGLLFFLFRLFRRKSTGAPAHAFAGAGAGNGRGMASSFSGHQAPQAAPSATVSALRPAVQDQGADIAINDADRHDFERLLTEVQDAFSNEDFGRLRERTTPEVMSYFAEELSQNATAGRRNSVAGTRLLDAEVAEAWREGATDYATIAMRYESTDVMLDRSTGAVLEGDSSRPTDTTELWTFRREPQGQWRLSAIQEA
ncbi:TIM44-like domain-containing protein [Sphingomonas sp. CCH5-D11]|uniref:TIM44-like domain-containing protein n=1 Tax=Sphingomonas sp. CCH5-D11 TaxID=1768786 RepID=UPI0008322687|nr:TIM44-like domain-containing protein [Sphingomonas sp. CCH5-D11]